MLGKEQPTTAPIETLDEFILLERGVGRSVALLIMA